MYHHRIPPVRYSLRRLNLRFYFLFDLHLNLRRRLLLLTLILLLLLLLLGFIHEWVLLCCGDALGVHGNDDAENSDPVGALFSGGTAELVAPIDRVERELEQPGALLSFAKHLL